MHHIFLHSLNKQIVLICVCCPQKSSKLSRISSGEEDLEDGKEEDQKSGSEGGDPDNGIIQNTADSKVGRPGGMSGLGTILIKVS